VLTQLRTPKNSLRMGCVEGRRLGALVRSARTGQCMRELDIKTKQTTMHLDAGVSDRLQSLCQQHHISREVLIDVKSACTRNPTKNILIVGIYHGQQSRD
jgi:hypothetical protein